ncbi:MAG: alginate lyase family protein [Pyrinomonadaceae bacterium]
MGGTFEKLKKLKGRSLKEIQTRGGQMVEAYREQIGLTGKLMNDQELIRAIRSDAFAANGNVTSEELVEKFYSDSINGFFSSFTDIRQTVRSFRERFGDEACRQFISSADKIIDGRIDLLGFLNLDFGKPIDWHYEPLSEKTSPIKHWKQFEDLDSRESGDKKIVWELNRHGHFFTLGMAFQLTRDERYAQCFVDHLMGWMEQNQPGMGVNWVSSLEVSFRAISWIWAFHMFRGSEAFTSDHFFEAVKFLYAHGRHIEKYLSTYFSPNTHLTGEALGLFYLGTQLGFLERASHWRKMGREILIGELERQIREDGVYFENSTWYQRYTADFYLQFMILQRFCPEKLGEEDRARLVKLVRRLLESSMHFTRPDGTTPLLGDDDGGRLLPQTTDRSDDFRGTLAVGAVVFERGDMKWVVGEAKQEVLWLLGPQGLAVYDALRSHRPEERSKAFEESGIYVMRDGWTEEDNYLLIDAGDMGGINGGHGHADTLAIELSVGGRTMLADSGTYTYHKSKELRNYYRSTAAHNTLTIDEKSSSEFGGVFGWETMARPFVHRWITQERFDLFEGSHDGFRRLESSPADYKRSILFLKNEYWILRDFVSSVGEHEYQQNFHFSPCTNPNIENLSNGQWCVTESTGEGVGVRLFTFGDNGAWQRKESLVSRRYGERLNAPFLRYVSKGIGPQEFFTFMMPCESGYYMPEVVETQVIGGRAFVVNFRNYQDLFVFADGGQIVRTEIFNTDFEFLWARMSEGERLPEEFVLINGKNFSLEERDIVRYPTPLEYATARRFGSKLNVRTSENVFAVSLPQKHSRTYVLKTTPEI